MIDFYFGPTPNARKVSIILEELKSEYRVIKVDILAEDQFRPEFLAINPNNKIGVLRGLPFGISFPAVPASGD
jgi:GSH-dependent disulfide-bond oxidoreductase